MQSAPVLGNKWYILSAYIGAHRSKAKLTARCHLKEGGYKDFSSEDIIGYSFSGGLSGYTKRAFVKFKAPSDVERITPIFWVISNSNESNKHLRVARPMLEECTEYTTEPSPWNNAGLTEVHGGSIIADTIRGNHIMANQEIRAPRITGGVITGNTVNGATVNGGTINGAVVSGGTVKGAIVEGGVIKAARLEGVTGKFTGTLEVNQLVGGNLCEVAIITVYKTLSFYQVWINIAPSPVKRIFFMICI